jgi:site-specific DNA-methyltransferase (adenine-specific)
MARKPLDGTVAKNVQKWGTGAINVDGCRVEWAFDGERDIADRATAGSKGYSGGLGRHGGKPVSKGRWPANLIHDGSEEVLELFPASKSTGGGGHRKHGIDTGNGIYGAYGERDLPPNVGLGDTGSAARFFYCAKSSRSERTANGTIVNGHPTIKPLSLMRYLCRLVTPPNGLILDPFMGSGTTGMAAKAEGFGFIGIEKEPEYLAIAERRIGATA